MFHVEQALRVRLREREEEAGLWSQRAGALEDGAQRAFVNLGSTAS